MLKRFLLISLIFFISPCLMAVKEEPKPVLPDMTMEAHNEIISGPEKIRIKLQGTDEERKVLSSLRDMVQAILVTSKYQFNKGVGENLEIIMSIQLTHETYQPHKVSLILKVDTKKPEKLRFFEYDPNDQTAIYQHFKHFLGERLQLVFPQQQKMNLIPAKKSVEPLSFPLGQVRVEQNGLNLSLKQETQTLLSETKTYFKDMAPSAKNITIKLQGRLEEQDMLHTLHAMVKNILNTSQLTVVEMPITREPIPLSAIVFYEQLEIIIRLQPPEQAHQPYQALVILQPEEYTPQSKSFNFYLENQPAIYQALKNFLAKQLYLTFPEDIMAWIELEKSFQENTTSLTEAIIPQPISSKTEVQLKNMTPAVKRITVKLQGTVREQDILHTLHAMVKDILNTSRLKVVRVPIEGEPIPTPVIKIYENLEIIISVVSSEVQDQPYQIDITLQEAGEKSVQASFEYDLKNESSIYQNLKDFLIKHLNLDYIDKENEFFQEKRS